MKKMLVVLALFMLAAPFAGAQAFEAIGNPIVVGGGTYQLEAPTTGNRAAFLISANIAGVKLGTLPLYFGGVGVALPATVDSIASPVGNFSMLTIPALTWFPGGNNPGTLGKVCLQVGYSYVMSGTAEARNGVYAGLGFGWNSPAYLRYRREVKAARAAGLKAGAAGWPKNPYDVQ
jgi:hypothetical protein